MHEFSNRKVSNRKISYTYRISLSIHFFRRKSQPRKSKETDSKEDTHEEFNDSDFDEGDTDQEGAYSNQTGTLNID